MTVHDDLGHPVELASPPRRIVSLVPSLTEALAATCRDRLVAATDWCIQPTDLEVPRVRGTKNPNRAAIEELSPDLVIANKEENRELDVRRLREAGVPVWVTDINTVDEALVSMRRLFVEALSMDAPSWLDGAASEWSQPVAEPTLRVACAIWRDPWMVVGAPTYTDDLMRHLGWANIFTTPTPREVVSPSPDSRYPHVELEQLDRDDVDVVLLPDEPYVFRPDDGPEAFARTKTVLVSGRLLTWYGPAMVGARQKLTEAVSSALGK